MVDTCSEYHLRMCGGWGGFWPSQADSCSGRGDSDVAAAGQVATP